MCPPKDIKVCALSYKYSKQITKSKMRSIKYFQIRTIAQTTQIRLSDWLIIMSFCMVGHWIKTKHGAIASTLKQESNLHLWSVTGVIYSPLLPCTHIAWSPCCWGWHIYSCFRMAGRQSDMSYCLSDASCLSSIPWTRRRELHNWRTNIPTSCSWVVIMMDLLTT